jgi:hypothetical protein
MCCFKSKVAKPLVVTFSVLTVLGALFIIGFCFAFLQHEAFHDDGLKTASQRIVVFSGLTACVSIIFGFFGICAAKIQRVFCVCSFGVLSVLLLTVYAIISFTLMSIIFVPPQTVEDFCNGDLDESAIPEVFKKMLEDSTIYIRELDSDLEKTVDKYMCTDLCPCVQVDYELWNATLQQELKKEKFDGGLYNFGGEYKSFYECYEDKKIAWEASGFEPVNQKVMNAVRDFENNLNCSGLCDPPNFWVFRDVTEGPPTTSCVYNLKNEFD